MPLSVASLRVLLDHAADFMEVHWDEDEGETKIPARPPRDVCESILAMPPHAAFPRLVSIRSVPVILPDGRLLAMEGYYKDSGILLRLRGLDGVRDDMPLEEAKAWLFHVLLGDFPFADEASRAHGMALLLEPFARPMIGGPTPLYLIDAPNRGAGKGLMADVAAAVDVDRVTAWQWRHEHPLFMATLQQRRAEVWRAPQEQLRALMRKAVENITAAVEGGNLKASIELLKITGMYGDGRGNAIGEQDPEHLLKQ
jgi:hypothetical protein